MARPKINIDWDYVDKQLRYHCKGTEIAAKFGIHPNTFYRLCEDHYKISYSECLEQKREEGNDLLRSAQFENAIEGNVSMQIWLGKQYLKQLDKQAIEHSGELPITGINYITPDASDNG